MTEPPSQGDQDKRPVRRGVRYTAWVVGGLVGLAVLVVLLALGASFAIPRPAVTSRPNPAADYAEAVSRIDRLKAQDSTDVGWGTLSYLQGSKVATAVVLFHGYTNNPSQFEQVGKAYADAGYNVLIPRLPGHGYRPLVNERLSEADPESLAAITDEAVDIAAGLGDRVEVVGLSGGGTLAAWAAYNRGEVDSAAALSPFIDPMGLPNPLVRRIVRLSSKLPDFHMWWDPRVKADRKPPDAYPRYSIRSMAAFLELAYAIEEEKPRRSGNLSEVLFVSNGADKSVNESFGYDVFISRLGPLADNMDFFEFPKADGYAHDLVDTNGENDENIDAIYGQLLPLLIEGKRDNLR